MAPPQTDNSLMAASRWYAVLASEAATEEDIAAWQSWKDADVSHQQAWSLVETLTQRLENLPANVNADTFLSLPANDRRLALKHLALLLGVGSASAWVYKAQPWREAFADYATVAGEIREVSLPDGSRMVLNTSTAVNLHFTGQYRLIELERGEVLIETAHEKNLPYRPLLVKTQHGSATALGTKFSVRSFDDYTKVSVAEGAVKIKPNDGDGITIHPGQSITFNENTHFKVMEEDFSLAWAKGLLVVYSMPLIEFTQELARYRSGVLRCDPAIGHLLVSGSFLINDTDAVLKHLTEILPVRVQSFTSYWLTIHPA